MLLNYLKLSFRLMARNPFFTVINVAGLAIGFASFIALWSYSVHELRSNQYHKDYERIARIGGYWRWTDDGGKSWDYVTFGFTKSDLAVRAMDDFPEVEEYTRILTQRFFSPDLVPHDKQVAVAAIKKSGDERKFKEDKLVYADQNLFNMLSIPLVHGNADDVLSEAGSVVLSERTARKYFDDLNPVGELLKLNDSITLKVSGVFENLPHYTHFDFDIVVSNKAYLTKWATAYFGAMHCYIKLRPGSSFQEFENKLNNKKEHYWSRVLSTKPNVDIDLFVQPLKDIAFSKAFEGDEFTTRSKSLLIAYATISIVILGMAWINYINLWVARNSKREKELATRKVNGASGTDFIFQFTVESFIINVIALVLAVTILQTMSVPFSALFNIQIGRLWSMRSDITMVILIVIVVGIVVTGIYPAIVSRANPRNLFHNNKHIKGKGIFSSFLAIAQYASAVVLMIWAFIVYLELNYVLHGEIGLDKENVVVIEAPVKKTKSIVQDFDNVTTQLLIHDEFNQITYGRFMPGDFMGAAKLMRRQGSNLNIGFDYNGVDENFLPFFGLRLVAGRNFVKDDRGDAVLISRYAALRLGFADPASAIGAKVQVDKSFQQAEWLPVEIIGVFEDYRTTSFFDSKESRTKFNNQQQSRGMLLTYKNRTFPDFLPERIAIKVNPHQLRQTLSKAEAEFNASFPGEVFSWYALDDNINKVYQNEKIARNQILLFVALAVGIACLGFLGMIMHKTISKTKEIGVRKILGANLSDIGQVIFQSSFNQLLFSLLLGVPTAWYLGEIYIQKFSARVPLEWWHFALPVLLLILIMVGTVASVVWKAAKTNPVEALKYE